MIKNIPAIKKSGGVALLILLLLGVSLLALRWGSASLSNPAFWGGLAGDPSYRTETLILYQLRLPRILGGILAGMGLSVSGALLQSITGNELAAPNIIGVNAGAGFAAILTLFFFPTQILWLPLGAFIGAFLATLLIIGIATRISRARSTIILVGVAVTALLNAGISLISLLDTDVLASYNHFSIGSLGGITFEKLMIPALLIAAALGISLIFARRIDVLCLGDEVAHSLGIAVKPLRILCLILASASAAAVVSFAGLLGFVGLMVPHMARRLGGGSIRRQLCLSAPLGGILVVSADLLGRLLFAPSELPAGILLAFLGAPFFFYLLIRRNHHER